MLSQTCKSLIKIGLAVVIATSSSAAVFATERLQMPKEGTDKAFLEPQPWSGFWWPRSKKGMVQVMEKYDSFVEKKTGNNPGAAAWESNPRNGHYNPSSPGWTGHCNGWAAASILEPEPKAPRTVEGISFSVGDQKGLLSEMYMDCYSEFYGRRKNDDFPLSFDIRPDLFHRLLVENIKTKKRGMVADISYNSPVWNYSICGYTSEWKPGGLLSKDSVRVTTTVYFADDGVAADFLGTKYLKKTYNYTLKLNNNGEIVGGNWTLASLWDHPDFVWIPTADAPPRGTGENPKLKTAMIYEITRSRNRTQKTPPLVMASVTRASADFESDHDSVLAEAGIDAAEYFD